MNDPSPRFFMRDTHRWSNWLLVICVIAGFLGQVFLQSQARLGEMPRTTLERLTGLTLGPHTAQNDMCASMPGMAMCSAEQSSPTRHDPDKPHNDGFCPLCPLLHLPAVTLVTAFALAVAMLAFRLASYNSASPSTPPAPTAAHLPPATGPPLLV